MLKLSLFFSFKCMIFIFFLFLHRGVIQRVASYYKQIPHPSFRYSIKHAGVTVTHPFYYCPFFRSHLSHFHLLSAPLNCFYDVKTKMEKHDNEPHYEPLHGHFMLLLCKTLKSFFVVHLVTYISKSLHFLTYYLFGGAVKGETTKTCHRIHCMHLHRLHQRIKGPMCNI